MKIKTISHCLLAVALVASSCNVFAKAQEFTPDQEKKIQSLIHDYLIEKPEVLIEAGQVLQQRQRTEMMTRAREAIMKNAAKLFQSTTTPVGGNLQGDVNIVEFFDYQCIHCKHMTEVVHDLIAKDSKVRVVYKQFPIFGESSEFAAKAALAANHQNKFAEFHQALMNAKERLNETIVLDLAKSVGLNVNQLKKDMKDPSVDQELKTNVALAESLGINATPVFIVASNPPSEKMKAHFIPGAIKLPMLESLLKDVR